jgi:lipid-A-disaccharide synthase-like uncharacterized protein
MDGFKEALTEPLAILGFFAQGIFFSRFLVQWISSEKKGESHIPIAFWYISIVGAMLMLAYTVLREEPILALGQTTGLTVYIRNLVLIYRKRRNPSTES